MKNLISLIVFILTITSVKAQIILPDRVTGTQNYANMIIKNYIAETFQKLPLDTVNITARIPIRLHVIKNNFGGIGVNPYSIYQSINNANTFFKNIGIQFFIDSIKYVNDYNYSFIYPGPNLEELIKLHALSNRLNLFLVDSIKMDNSQRTYGYTYFPDEPEKNYIFLDKKFTEGNYLTTMLGHFMGLLSTHDNSISNELVNGSNCYLSGDFICDTYADPDLFDQVDENCNYLGTSVDRLNKYYVPSVANLMSNAPDKCKCVFTYQQYRRMYFYYLHYRQYLK